MTDKSTKPELFTKEAYLELIEEIRHHATRYYLHDDPEISDADYDQMFRLLLKVEEANPEWVSKDSPSQTVAAGVTFVGAEVEHKRPMLSLDNVFNDDELDAWCEGINKALGKKVSFTIEPKYDGLAITSDYEEGELVQAATRGDGAKGEDLTANFASMVNVKQSLKEKELINLRGEALLPLKSFEEINEALRAEGKKEYVNPRNAAAGIMRSHDPEAVRKAKMFFMPYSLYKGEDECNLGVLAQFVSQNNLGEIEDISIHNMTASIKSKINSIIETRNDRKFEIDGAVIKVNNVKDREALGFTGRVPKWAIAFKFPAEQKQTTLLEVVWQVGRTGAITPVAKVEPVKCGGVTVSSITLHNVDEVERLGIKTGDKIVIQRAGDVIPQIVKVLTEERTGEETDIAQPTECPICGSDVEVSDKAAIVCSGGYSCKAQSTRYLMHYVSRKVMNIDGFGEKLAEQLIELGIVKSPLDIYDLTLEDLTKLDKVGEKKAKGILAEIDKSLNVSLDRFIYALGIAEIGESTAKAIAEHYGTLESFLEANKDSLKSIKDVGDVVAGNVDKFLHDNKGFIDSLLAKGVKPSTVEKVEVKDSPIKGKSFVITGGFHISRNDIKAQVINLGGTVKGSVSKKTDYLIAGSDAGGKLKAAEDLGISILSYSDFENLIK